MSECGVAGVWSSSGDVDLIGDTISDIPEGYGIYLENVDPRIADCQIDQCEYGLYAWKSSSRISDIDITGPGAIGVYILWTVGGQRDTLRIDSVRVNGYFSVAHVYCDGTYGRIDSSEFITGIDSAGTSPYGMVAYGYANDGLKVRKSRIKDFGYTGFYSDQTGKSDLGYYPSWNYGSNRIETSVDSAYFVRHFMMLGTPELKAVGNWWGEDQCPPDSTRFVLTNYDECLGSKPFEKFATGIAPVSWEYGLGPNYPNPFNPGTTIEFSMAKQGHMRLEIFNILGQKVRVVADAEYSEGLHRVFWDGNDQFGRAVASGVYLYRIAADGYMKSRKMVVLK